MNQALSDFRSYIKGKRVALIGMGISNASTVDFLLSCGAILTARDQKTDLPGREEWEAKGVRTVTGDGYLDDLNEDLLLKSPGIRPDVPEIADAVGRGAVLESEIGLFCRLCPCPIYAVTGSDGKTTTTTLIARFLEEERKNTDRRVFLGGNIGTPLLSSVGEMTANDKVVLELSSFQLITMVRSPETAVITNLSPNHLDVHKSYEEYGSAKKNIFRYQSAYGTLVVNADNAFTAECAGEANGKVLFFSRRSK
ncbi:MAG: UDP-N-acetylmuramoyl-L-alanine--D-glutamate ligase, partial [Ruminococcus sp.]|nr:UDP-N-acetylmuramoyl-L-alanine--D-glutamate ligase [Candidatus Apopatosoma intestinale]